jgi:hypothetical protein
VKETGSALLYCGIVLRCIEPARGITFPFACNFDQCSRFFFTLLYTYATSFGLIGHLLVFVLVFQGKRSLKFVSAVSTRTFSLSALRDGLYCSVKYGLCLY